MPFKIRKSIAVGPFRFNASTSGLGMSVGVKGLRIGTGPRGNYIRVGSGGLSYRVSVPTQKSQVGPKLEPPNNGPSDASNVGPEELGMREIESGDVTQMTDTNADEILREITKNHKKISFWPIVSAAGFAGAYFLHPGLLIAGIVGGLVMAYFDNLRKRTVLFFDLEGAGETTFRRLTEAFDAVGDCTKIWHVEAEGDVENWKHQAGADKIIRRKSISLKYSVPHSVRTNVSVPAIPVGRQTLYLFPDRIYVFDRKDVGAVGYDELEISVQDSIFIEDGKVPSDAEVIDYTWKHPNRSGGPDKRFSNNFQIPIVNYEEIYFRSPTGLKELVQVSKKDQLLGLADALSEAGRHHAKFQ